MRSTRTLCSTQFVRDSFGILKEKKNDISITTEQEAFAQLNIGSMLFLFRSMGNLL